MKAVVHSMPEACSEASPTVQLVQIEVSPTHPLLLLKRALPWDTLTEVMTRHWRQHGKNVDGGPGLPWDKPGHDIFSAGAELRRLAQVSVSSTSNKAM